jgi:branched-chain amino acid transport system substrate-binding protein
MQAWKNPMCLSGVVFASHKFNRRKQMEKVWEKNRMKVGRELSVILLAVGIMVGIAVYTPSVSGAAEPIIIGQLTALSGAGASQGIQAAEGVKIAIEELNAKGGVLGRKFQHIVLDDKANAEHTSRQIKTLILDKKVNFIVGLGGNTAAANVGSDYIKSAKVMGIIFNPCTPSTIQERGHRYVFRMGHDNTAIARTLAAAVALKWNKPKRIYGLNQDYEFGHDFWKEFTQEYKKLVPDMQIVGEAWAPFPSQEYSSYISAILAKKPDLVVDSMWGTDGLALIKQCVAFGAYKKVHWAGWSVGDIASIGAIKRGEAAPIGALGNFSWPYWALDNQMSKNLYKKLYARLKTPPCHPAANGYAAMYAVARAIKEAGTVDTEAVINKLEGMTVDSPVGKVYIRPCDHQAMWPEWGGVIDWEEGWNFPHEVNPVTVSNINTLYNTCEESLARRRAYQAQQKK